MNVQDKSNTDEWEGLLLYYKWHVYSHVCVCVHVYVYVWEDIFLQQTLSTYLFQAITLVFH